MRLIVMQEHNAKNPKITICSFLCLLRFTHSKAYLWTPPHPCWKEIPNQVFNFIWLQTMLWSSGFQTGVREPLVRGTQEKSCNGGQHICFYHTVVLCDITIESTMVNLLSNKTTVVLVYVFFLLGEVNSINTQLTADSERALSTHG